MLGVGDCDYGGGGGGGGGTNLSKAGERARKEKDRERERDKGHDQNRGCGGGNGSEVVRGLKDEGGEAVGGGGRQVNGPMSLPKAVTAVTKVVAMRGWLLLKGANSP